MKHFFGRAAAIDTWLQENSITFVWDLKPLALGACHDFLSRTARTSSSGRITELIRSAREMGRTSDQLQFLSVSLIWKTPVLKVGQRL